MGRGGRALNTVRMAEDFIKRSERFLKEASLALSEDDYATCVRRSQECVEMSLKAVLRLLAIEYPLKHDVSEVILKLDHYPLPDWFKEHLPYLAETSRVLAKLRGPAMYGSEDELRPASDLFTKADAESAYKDAEKVFRLCSRIIDSWLRK
ncbi:MAG: HEPN domain-containing protein [Nitrososphaerota archaeon]|nr:HEPN domain-containing protein [Nitrososphaerota archaeon]